MKNIEYMTIYKAITKRIYCIIKEHIDHFLALEILLVFPDDLLLPALLAAFGFDAPDFPLEAFPLEAPFLADDLLGFAGLVLFFGVEALAGLLGAFGFVVFAALDLVALDFLATLVFGLLVEALRDDDLLEVFAILLFFCL